MSEIIKKAASNEVVQLLYNDLRERQENSVGIIAPNYADLTFPVAQGQPCIHEGLYYIANSAIQSSEDWTAAHWTQLTVGEQVTDVLTAIQGKQDAPSTAGTSGQVLSLDNNLHPVWVSPSTASIEDGSGRTGRTACQWIR